MCVSVTRTIILLLQFYVGHDSVHKSDITYRRNRSHIHTIFNIFSCSFVLAGQLFMNYFPLHRFSTLVSFNNDLF